MKRYLMKWILPFLLLTTSLPVLSQLPDSIIRRVVIVRHGEKPGTGDNLSCEGLNRALALPDVLDSLFGKPDYAYVPKIHTGKSTSNARMFQTITPFAVRYNLTVDSKYKETDTAAVAADILKKKGTIVLVWEHGNIPGVARNLGIKKKDLHWDGSDFDSIWIIDFVNNNGNWTPRLKKGKEHIHPSHNCPEVN
jgi:hypothetical protein